MIKKILWRYQPSISFLVCSFWDAPIPHGPDLSVTFLAYPLLFDMDDMADSVKVSNSLFTLFLKE